jgi:hypothetical protein
MITNVTNDERIGCEYFTEDIRCPVHHLTQIRDAPQAMICGCAPSD